MKRITYVILFIIYICVFPKSLITNSPIFLSAQSGWSEDMRLTFDYAYSADPMSACWGESIHLVWWKNYLDSLSNFHDEVFYKRSTDAGETWGDDVMLSVEDTQTSALPQIAASGDAVHVVWFEEDFGLFYRRSTNGGETWGDVDSIVPLGVHSSIDVFEDTVYICGVTGSTGDLLFTKSIDSGNNWGPIQTITFSAHDSPTLKIMSNNVLNIAISYEYTPEIYNVRSFDGGQTWLDSQLVSEGIGSGSQEPTMDTDNSAGIHITWYDYKYSPYAWTGDIFCRASRDSGNTWEETDSLTVMHRAVASDILAEGSNLHLVWEDDRHGFNNNFEIYYRMSPDLGQTWRNEVRLTDAPYHSRKPSLACDGNFLHLFWSDQRDSGNTGPWMLYYKRKNLIGINEKTVINTHKGSLILECPTVLTKRTLVYYDLSNYKKGDILIMDVTGRVVANFPVHQVSGYFMFGSNKDVCDGIYFLMLRAGKERVIKKAVKVR